MTIRRLFILATLLTLPAVVAAMEIPPSWTTPVMPVRIVGNVYYVGTAELGSYLLVGKEGAILLDAPLEENAGLVLRNIESLGVDAASIRILLNSHAHADHAGGLATIKKTTNATLYLSSPDAALATRGGLDDFAFGDTLPYPAVSADEILTDGQTVRLGDLSMTALITPGHTRGCTTWQTTVEENGTPVNVVFLCSVTAPGYTLVGNEKYPEILDDYRTSFERLRKLEPDVFLANHGSFFGLRDKLKAAKEGNGNPFFARGEFSTFLDRAWDAIESAVARQREASGTAAGQQPDLALVEP